MADKKKVAKKKTVSVKKAGEVRIVNLPIVWNTPDHIISRYVTNMVVQSVDSEMKLSFFEIKPDIQLDGNRPITEVRADCVASIIVTPSRMQQFMEVMQQHLDKQNKIAKLQKKK